jgi:hypothetical protein
MVRIFFEGKVYKSKARVHNATSSLEYFVYIRILRAKRTVPIVVYSPAWRLNIVAVMRLWKRSIKQTWKRFVDWWHTSFYQECWLIERQTDRVHEVRVPWGTIKNHVSFTRWLFGIGLTCLFSGSSSLTELEDDPENEIEISVATPSFRDEKSKFLTRRTCIWYIRARRAE